MASFADRKQEVKTLFWQGQDKQMFELMNKLIEEAGSQEDKWDMQLLKSRFLMERGDFPDATDALAKLLL
jgi:hypothetical protein